MSGLNGYVGSSADAQRIRRLEEKRQKEKADFEARPAAPRRAAGGAAQPYACSVSPRPPGADARRARRRR